ncbi:penicillin-binding transpeptidase domain-containing protein [Clostridium sp. ZBS12]|uniref:penicillin-binding transpeptidase domain-containing protein n=1 Tax=Clostridium sp. ZBS12 TaxID=2949972 RepID=UPI00207A46C4|nr:penicillin-binding transpeptidase domain-containing protein [Clostridium sp. ZBS12]
MKKYFYLLEITLVFLILLTACSNNNAIDNNNKTLDERIIDVETENSQYNKEEQIRDIEEDRQYTNEIEKTILNVDFRKYFQEYEGCAVFYLSSSNTYKIYNAEIAQERRSPCSTFKIISTLAALENEVITNDNSKRYWSGEKFWNESWNKDMMLNEAFKTSCIWYYREIINEIGMKKMQSFVSNLGYGNEDISDWEGKLNKNNNNRSLTGFWVESSLKISPLEQVDVLYRIFGEDSEYREENIETLLSVMELEDQQDNITVYGKTGYGRLKSVSLDSWFIGLFESGNERGYFAVRLSETENPNVLSALAKEIALKIISENF